MKKDHIRLEKVREAAIALSKRSEKERNAFLRALAGELHSCRKQLVAANKKDVAAARAGRLSEALVQRLVLDARGLRMLDARLRDVEKLRGGLGEVMEKRSGGRGLIFQKVRTPLGVVLVIYESRPEVTIDVAALCIKSGNAAILKGGSEAAHTDRALYRSIQSALRKSGFQKETITCVEDRNIVRSLLKRHAHVDLVIARGGYGLVRAVLNESTIPVLAHAAGGARIYVDDSADLKMAEKILVNAKTSKPAACNSLDTIVVHAGIAKRFVPRIVEAMLSRGVQVIGDARARTYASVRAARKRDWDAEFLGLTVGIAIVKDAQEAIHFVNQHSKRHSEGIIASDTKVVDQFCASIDAAAIFVNCSTRLHDGYIFGLGSEMGIAAGKLHARGPVGLKELTTYKWQVYGKGNIRN